MGGVTGSKGGPGRPPVTRPGGCRRPGESTGPPGGAPPPWGRLTRGPPQCRRCVRRLQGTSLGWLSQRAEVVFLPDPPERASAPVRAAALSDWLLALVTRRPPPSGAPRRLPSSPVTPGQAPRPSLGRPGVPRRLLHRRRPATGKVHGRCRGTEVRQRAGVDRGQPPTGLLRHGAREVLEEGPGAGQGSHRPAQDRSLLHRIEYTLPEPPDGEEKLSLGAEETWWVAGEAKPLCPGLGVGATSALPDQSARRRPARGR